MIRLTPRFVHAAQLTALVLVALVAFAGAGSTGAATAPAGLVAAYSFDAGTGTTLADSSGLANTGTISGASWANGRNGALSASTAPTTRFGSTTPPRSTSRPE